MDIYKEFIESGILELYVMDLTTADENKSVADMAALYPEVRQEINEISLAMERYALENTVEPDPIVKPFLMATIDYTDRLKNGEAASVAPLLSETSKADDYTAWLERADMVLPEDFEGVHAKIISYTPEALTAIVWLKHMAPQEVHDNEYEKFLVLEGTCDIVIGEDINSLKAGDYLCIPLHQNHHVLVTSAEPCKVILQRVAA